MEKTDVELREGEGLVRTTIVGGQPRKRPAMRMKVRVGLERVLYRAALDRHFREALLADRPAALASAGFELDPSEHAVLASVDRDSLAAMIAQVDPAGRKDRRFMRAVAATFVTLASGTAMLVEEGCELSASTGIQPDDVTEIETAADDQPTRGILADEGFVDPGLDPAPPFDPGIVLDVPENIAPGGILPEDFFTSEEVSVDAEVTAFDGGIQPDVPSDLPSATPRAPARGGR